MLAIAGHDGFVILPGKRLKDNFFDSGMGGTEHRLHITGAILKLQPHEDRLAFLGEGVRDGLRVAGRQSERCGHRRTELHKPATRHTAHPACFENRSVKPAHRGPSEL